MSLTDEQILEQQKEAAAFRMPQAHVGDLVLYFDRPDQAAIDINQNTQRYGHPAFVLASGDWAIEIVIMRTNQRKTVPHALDPRVKHNKNLGQNGVWCESSQTRRIKALEEQVEALSAKKKRGSQE